MEIQEKNSIFGLKNIIFRLFDVQFDDSEYSKYHQDLPVALKELYEIDAHFSQDCSYDTIHFFCNLDRLVKPHLLKTKEKSFVFVHENQHNWTCETQLNSNKVYFNDHVEPEKSRFLATTIDQFLTTFALQEIGLNLKFYFGFEYEDMEEIKENFKKIEILCTDKNYIYSQPFSYYLIDDDCLVMWAGMNIFATNNEEKYEYYKGILKHYNF
jgi:hypothetical protein